jgi:hypothetical protein
MPMTPANKTRAKIASAFVVGAAAAGIPTAILEQCPPPPPTACTAVSTSSSSVQKAIDTLASGGTLCLDAGTYTGNLTFDADGNKTLRSTPGQRATVKGRITVKDNSDGVTIADLDINGIGSTNAAVLVQGDQLTIDNVDMTNTNKGTAINGICVLAGPGFESTPANTAEDLTVTRSRIHNCGDDNHEHALYLESTRNAHVSDSYLYDNPGMGLDFYPDAQGTLAEFNTIDGNSIKCKENVGFSGEKSGGEYKTGHGSSNNVVTSSNITFAVCRYNVDSYYPKGSIKPVGNVVKDSCVFSAPFGNFGGTSAYSTSNIITQDPQYVNRAAKNFTLSAGSPCAGKGPRSTP